VLHSVAALVGNSRIEAVDEAHRENAVPARDVDSPVEQLAGVNEDLSLVELDGLAEAAHVSSAALVVRDAGEHEVPRQVAAVVVLQGKEREGRGREGDREGERERERKKT